MFTIQATFSYILTLKVNTFFKIACLCLIYIKKYRHMENMMKKILFTSIALAVILAGCNTVRGVGQDVSKAGNAVSNTAEKTQQKM